MQARSRPPAWVAIAICCVFVACRHHGPPGPLADRSDGALPTLDVHHVEPDAIVIDGHADEPAWKLAASTGTFVEPGSGKPATASHVNALARLAWSDVALYVTVTVHDDHAGTPFHRDDVDPHIWERASGVELMLQPGDRGDNRDYYEIQVDPAGATWDTRFDDYNRPVGNGLYGHQDWKSGLQRAASIDASAGTWTVELALPWSSVVSPRAVAPPRPQETWRANLYSFRDGQRDALAWSPILGRGNFHLAARFGRLKFVQ